VSDAIVRSFYRAAKHYPPKDDAYLTLQDRKGDPPADYPEAVKRSWDALSAFDSEQGVREATEEAPHIGKLIVRFDVPEGAGVTWEQTGPPGHYDLRGDMGFLKRCLTDFVAKV